LKIAANSVYGFSALQNIDIAKSIIAEARNLLHTTKSFVTTTYPHSRIVAGDTDSVMIAFGVGNDLAQAFQLGRDVITSLNSTLEQPLKLELETVYRPMLITCKKRYAGMKFTDPTSAGTLECKGMEIMRRDTPPFIRRAMEMFLHRIIVMRQKTEAYDYLKSVVADISNNRLDLSDYVVASTVRNLTTLQPHAVVAEKRRLRDPAQAPVSDDRVPYVIIEYDCVHNDDKKRPRWTSNRELAEHALKSMERNRSNTDIMDDNCTRSAMERKRNYRLREFAEDPEYVIANGLSINRQYYIDRFKMAIGRLFEEFDKERARVILEDIFTIQSKTP